MKRHDAVAWQRPVGWALIAIGVLGFVASATVGGGGSLEGSLVAGVLNPLFFLGIPLGCYLVYRYRESASDDPHGDVPTDPVRGIPTAPQMPPKPCHEMGLPETPCSPAENCGGSTLILGILLGIGLGIIATVMIMALGKPGVSDSGITKRAKHVSEGSALPPQWSMDELTAAQVLEKKWFARLDWNDEGHVVSVSLTRRSHREQQSELSGAECLKYLPHLERVRLWGFGDEVIPYIEPLPISEVDVVGCKLTSAAVVRLKNAGIVVSH